MYFKLIDPIIVILHELGHSIFGLLLTNDKVTLKICTVDNRNEIKIIKKSFGRFYFFIPTNIYNWQRGYCSCNGEFKNNKHEFLYMAGGVMMPIIFLGVITICLFYIKSIFVLILIYPWLCVINSTFINLYPKKSQFKVNNKDAYTDGFYIQNIITKSLNKIPVKINKYYQEGNYKEVIKEIDKMLIKHPQNEELFRIKILSLIKLKQINEAKELSNLTNQFGVFDELFAQEVALIYLKMGYWDNAEYYYSIALNFNANEICYLLRGYVRLKNNEYAMALADFNKSYSLGFHESILFAFRAEVYMLLNLLDLAYVDLQKGYELLPKLSYLNLIFGHYFLLKKKHDIALIYLGIAKKNELEYMLYDQNLTFVINENKLNHCIKKAEEGIAGNIK